jgi:hypothetical protein
MSQDMTNKKENRMTLQTNYKLHIHDPNYTNQAHYKKSILKNHTLKLQINKSQLGKKKKKEEKIIKTLTINGLFIQQSTMT